jgi:hypothetical protein
VVCGDATSGNSVTLTKATLAGAANNPAVLAGATGKVTLDAGNTLTLAATGTVDVTGTGSVVVGTTYALKGVGTWTAGVDTVEFEAGASDSNAGNITGGTSATLTPSGTAPTLYLLAASDAQELTIGGGTQFTLDLSAKGSITFDSTTTGSTITLTKNSDGIVLKKTQNSELAIVGTNSESGSTIAGAFVDGAGTFAADTCNVSLIDGVIKNNGDNTNAAAPAAIDKNTLVASLAATNSTP